MKILLNALPLTGVLTGIARYTRNLYTSLSEMEGIELEYFDGRSLSPTMPIQNGSPSWMVKRRWTWAMPDQIMFALRSAHWLRFEAGLRKAAREHQPDIYHETGFVPAKVPAVPIVYNIYDLSLIHYPHAHPRERVWFSNFFLPRRLDLASHVLTISNTVRLEILEHFKLPEERVTAIPLAPDPNFYPRTRSQISSTVNKLGLPDEYLLFVGTLEPRKNLSNLIQALALMNHKIPLVIAGWSGWGDKSWLQHIHDLKISNRVYLAGHVGEEDLACLYSQAAALAYPSFYEGFGLPLLEAMACGCPVVCSNVSALPETAGEAALYINPQMPQDIAQALDRIVEDQSLARDLTEKGMRRAAAFTWERAAKKTMELFLRFTPGRD